MAETNDVQALEMISTEVVDSQVKIILSSQCIKAQAFLFDKLRKQSERQKEICKFISSSNLKLETEIQLAEQEIKSHNIALETIKIGNIELRTEYLLSKERKADIFERTKIGKKKYENLWSTSKKKYESIPHIQNLIQSKNKTCTIQANIHSFINESEQLISQIKIKKNDLAGKDRTRIIELADFFYHKRPKTIEAIDSLSTKIRELSDGIEKLLKEEQESKNNYMPLNGQPVPKNDLQEAKTTADSTEEDNWCNLSKNIDKDAIVLPRLHLQNNDLDILSVKLDQIKKVDLQNSSSMKRIGSFTSFDFEQNSLKRCKNVEKIEECYISSYFDISINEHFGNDDKKIENKQYADKKLIHILEDIKLNKNDTYEMIKKLEPNKLQQTCYITTKVIDKSDKFSNTHDKVNKTVEIEEIKEIDLTKEHVDTVAPPSQFLDIIQNTQEKKTVSFNVPNEDKIPTSLEDLARQEETEVNASQEKTLNTSKISEDSFTTIKDMMLKKHNLDLSPQFVYGKNTLMHMSNNDKIITSKFFENKNKVAFENKSGKDVNTKEMGQDEIIECKETEKIEDEVINENKLENMEVTNIAVSSPKQEDNNLQVPVAGLLFNHGSQCIPDSLNISINTTGFEDEDFPHCIDSSILLSPKADIPTTAISSNNEVVSQDVPNFLAGFRKTGLSFFGSTLTPESKPGSSTQNPSSGFNFTFGNDEKKGRSGFFSMFR
ncbi:uncharacterized protein [Epargyreus clarus]|uniref:uncharacterized protein isoform X1 n=1 Tax=Epargyreus clarus TaxID=520877 RepID=UPI003C30E370